MDVNLSMGVGGCLSCDHPPFKFPQQDLIRSSFLIRSCPRVPALCFMQMQSHVVEKVKESEWERDERNKDGDCDVIRGCGRLHESFSARRIGLKKWRELSSDGR